ncbi:hypothetical protein Dsin_003778 [Dipteronia sinensis]|uniref:CCHC-type domain-containing protein n=1 Tax=Dipteronia sinensis TaxID=43782 RepID=A0AAE0B9S4_9ROSI|nr:hypothetical protein Dsin_003778 [Dipteronia sinensis]
MMKLSPKLKDQLQKPWANALILKNMGRVHTLNFVLTKLTQKWSLIGQRQLTDLGDGYFVARFQMKDDLDYVLTSGHWVIANQYMICKVDPITKNQARCRFARICVEIDIFKPLLGYLYIDDRVIRVEYESLGLICLKCGRYGHSRENCREGVIEEMATEDDREVIAKKDEHPYGP